MPLSKALHTNIIFFTKRGLDSEFAFQEISLIFALHFARKYSVQSYTSTVQPSGHDVDLFVVYSQGRHSQIYT